MASIDDISIVNSNTAEAIAVESGLEQTLCSSDLCGSKTLTVYRRTVMADRRLLIEAGDDYHVVYVIAQPAGGLIRYEGETHDAAEGAGVLLA